MYAHKIETIGNYTARFRFKHDKAWRTFLRVFYPCVYLVCCPTWNFYQDLTSDQSLKIEYRKSFINSFDDICRLLFYYNKLPFGKTFICKVERLTVKQLRSRWDGSLSRLIWICALFVLRFYGPVNLMGSCRARSVYLTTHLLGRLSPLSG